MDEYNAECREVVDKYDMLFRNGCDVRSLDDFEQDLNSMPTLEGT